MTEPVQGVAHAASETRTSGISDAYRRAGISAAVLALVGLLEHVPLPGLSLEFVALLARGRGPQGSPANLSLAALGFMPFISGFLAVEVAAWLVPRWNRWRFGDPRGRQKLVRAALVVSLGVAALQAFGLSMYLEATAKESWQFGMDLLWLSGWAFRGLIVLSLCAGTALLWWLSTVITRWGLGHGVSLLLAWGQLKLVLPLFVEARSQTRLESADLLRNLACAISLAVVFAVLLEATWAGSRLLPSPEEPADGDPYRRGAHASTGRFLIRMLPCGVLPLSLAIAVPAIAGRLSNLLGSAGGLLVAGTSTPLVASLIIVLLAAPFGLGFYPERDVLRLFERAKRSVAAMPESRSLNDDASGLRLFRIGLSVTLLAGGSGLVLVTWLATLVAPSGVAAPLLAIALLVAVSFDLLHEWRARAALGTLVPVWTAHRVYEADAALDLLRSAGIPAVTQGLRHRALFHFFAPYVGIAVLAPESDAPRGHELVRRAFTSAWPRRGRFRDAPPGGPPRDA